MHHSNLMSAMVVEKSNTTSAELDAIRQESVRKRILSQEWAGQTIDHLSSALALLQAQPPRSLDEYVQKLPSVLDYLDILSAASEAAAASVSVTHAEKEHIINQTSEVEKQIKVETEKVLALRKELAREKKMAERRSEYDAMSSLILRWADCDSSLKRKQEAMAESDRVSKDVERLAGVKDSIAKEVRLLLHCADGLQKSCIEIADMVEDSEPQAGDAMDTS